MTDISPIADEIVTVLPSITRRIIMQTAHAVDFTPAQIFTMIVLDEIGSCRFCDLKDQLQISAPTATGIIDRLETADLVKRQPDPKDRRAINVALTSKGRKLTGKLKEVVKAKWVKLLTDLTDDEVESFISSLRKIKKVADEKLANNEKI